MTPPKTNCPDLTKWKEFLDGNLGALTTAELERHLEECDVCVEQADTLCNLGDDTLSRMDHYVLHPDDRSTVERLIQTAHAMAGDYSTHFLTSDGSNADQFEFLSPGLEQNEIGRLGKYSIRGVLGTGGMGVVFRAYDAALEREVAVKVIQPKYAESDDAKQRFLREAKMTAGIEHDHIVTIHQVDVANGVPFLAMQLLQGESLQARLLRETCLTEIQAIGITAQIAKGLAAAHDAGLVHRDIKPGNIWLREGDDAVRILDFGLARTDHDVGMTRTGEMVGTPRYMSPEQARGESLDGRSDLFSLGCVLFRMLTGRAPVEKSDMISTLVAVVNDEIDPIESLLPELDPELASLINDLLSIDLDSRPATAQQVAVRLQQIETRLSIKESDVQVVLDRPEIAPKPAKRSQSKSRSFVIAFALCVVIVGTVAFQLSTPRSDSREVASWILSMGGEFETSSPYARVRSSTEIPSGNWEIVSVNFNGCRGFQPSDFGRLSNQELNEISCLDSDFGDEFLVALSENNKKTISGLTNLYAVRSAVSDRGINALSVSNGLKQLSLGMTQFRDCNLLRPFTELNELDVSYCPLLPDSLPAIHDLPLATLDINAEHWNALAPQSDDRLLGLTTIRILGIVESTNFDLLSRIKGVTTLSLSGQNRSAAIPRIWDRMSNLNWSSNASLHIDGIALPRDGEEVGDLSEIGQLTLSHLDQSQNLIGLLLKMPNLRSLTLQYATPSDDQIAQLSQFTQLESLGWYDELEPDPSVVDRLRQQMPDCEIAVD